MVKRKNDCHLWEELSVIKVEIDMILPTFEEYADICGANNVKSVKYKKHLIEDIGIFIGRLPEHEKDIAIVFHWIGWQDRGIDDVCLAKKLILDALVHYDKLSIQNRLMGLMLGKFQDRFRQGDEAKVILEIMEI